MAGPALTQYPGERLPAGANVSVEGAWTVSLSAWEPFPATPLCVEAPCGRTVQIAAACWNRKMQYAA